MASLPIKTAAAPDAAYARTVLRAEARAIASLEERIGDEFLTAANLILNLETAGRVVVAGMGKAGIIGQKIAATFASTGTPALFMHPAEGVHGDLGMATRQDVALAVSSDAKAHRLQNHRHHVVAQIVFGTRSRCCPRNRADRRTLSAADGAERLDGGAVGNG